MTGMTCSACSARVQKAVEKLAGTREVSVNLLTNSMQLSYDAEAIEPEAIIAAVEKAGYGAALQNQPVTAIREQTETAAAGQAKALKQRLLWSLAFLLPMMYVSMHGMLAMMGVPVPDAVRAVLDGTENALAFAFSQFLLLLPIMYLNRQFYIVGFRTLFQGAPNMDTLVGLGSMASALFGVVAIFRIGYGLGHGDMALVQSYCTNLYFESAGMIVTLITVGKFLEARAKGQTSRALEKLMDLAPKEAHVLRAGQELTLPVEKLAAGDVIIVRPGERIPADGKITEGSGVLDESAVTGESLPVAKGVGDMVISASINQNGSFRFVAQKVGAESAIAQIIRLVEEASASKAPIARLADRVASVFVPVVMGIALLTGLAWYYGMGADFEFAAGMAIAVLVISCPCALGLATPVAIMVGTGRGAEQGILMKSGEALERAQAVDTVVLDKTGTITEGKPVICAVEALAGSEAELLAAAAGLEAGSEHPLARAVLEFVQAQNIPPLKMADFQAVPGRGVQARAEGAVYRAGNARYMEEQGIGTEALQEKLAGLADKGATPLLIARQERILGILAAADRPKADSGAAIAAFREMGIDVVMLTGDNARTAKALQAELHIPQVIAEVLPQHKAEHIAKLQAAGHRVAMIGDGINDAPALAQADVGIAIGAGTDVALESADAVLVKSSLWDAVKALHLSRAVLRNIKENLFWAFFYNVICIPLAAGVLYPFWGLKLSPMMGAAAMSLSSVCVCLNALRLRRSALPAAAEHPEDYNRKEEIAMEKTLQIEGMMCAHCQKHVNDALSKMAGVTQVNVNLEAGTATVTAERDIPEAEFAQVITEAGYELK